MQYWLMKSEPGTYGIEDLKKEKNQTDYWDGVRNYQARNFMKTSYHWLLRIRILNHLFLDAKNILQINVNIA